MQVVCAAHSLAGAGGSETYIVTVADHLQRLGHDVCVYTTQAGRSTEAARQLGLRVVAVESDLPPAPDALLVQDGVVACDLAAHWTAVPQAFVAHSDTFDVQLPPQLPGLVAAVIVLYDRVDSRIRALAEPIEDVVRLAQPIDVERFKPTQPLHERPQMAMALGNYVHGERLELLRRACARAGVELRHVGQFGEGERPADQVLGDADIVFGKARVILEAMACGRAAYVFDHNGGDGWVTAATYPELAPDNFGGQSASDTLDEDRIVADLALYDRGMGVVNRDLVVANHAAGKHAVAVAEVLERVARTPRAAPVDAPLRELSRMIRLYHRADSQAFALRAECERLGARTMQAEERTGELAQQLESQAAHARALEARLADAQRAAAAQAHEAARLQRKLRDVTASRRWRALQAVLAPVDRARMHGRAAAPAGPPSAPAPAGPPGTPKPNVSAVTAAPTTAPGPPAPFVVGVPRSGTTLLRMQLDSHPELAVGPETGFGLIAGMLRAHADPDELLDALVALDTWPDLGLDRDHARRLLLDVRPWSVGAGLRALYGALAAQAAKARWGDKTPAHLGCMPAIAAALPEARFIHIIRDGRDVADSVRGLPFAPGDGSIEAIAADWRDRIVQGRRDATGLACYRELRFERLVHEPETVLRELCEFLELEFDDAMLRAHERAAGVLAQLPHTARVNGQTSTRSERIARHIDVTRPPDPSLIGRWRTTLSADEIARFEAVAGEMLSELGYEVVAS